MGVKVCQTCAKLLRAARANTGGSAVAGRNCCRFKLRHHPAVGAASRQHWRRLTMASMSTAETQPAPSEAPAHSLMAALAIPPGPNFQMLGARVEHLLAPTDGLLSELVTRALDLPQGAAELLLRFGAIFTCPVPPAMPEEILAAMQPEQAAQSQRNRQAALKRAGNSSQARTPQRMTEDKVVPQHSYIRVHVHPKRFPACYSVAWQDRIIADTPAFVVVSKPPGVPAAPTVDNLLESAPSMAAQAISHPTSLLVTHRLDQCTEGLLVLGKTKAFVTQFNELVKRSAADDTAGAGEAQADSSGGGSSSNGSLENGNRGAVQGSNQCADASSNGGADGASAPGQRGLRKFYRAATLAPPPLGLLRHHLSLQRRHVGLPVFTVAHDQPVEGSMVAELRVAEVRPIRLSPQASAAFGAAEAHECLLELLTGRTHQIRAQLSAVGCPLLGDSLYQPLACATLRQRLFSGDPCEDLRHGSGSAGRLLEEPTGGIGLQACRLESADACLGGSPDEPAVFEAGPPWWRS